MPPDHAGEGDPGRFCQLLSSGALQFGSAQPGHPLALPALDHGQAVRVLELGTDPREGLFGHCQISTRLPSSRTSEAAMWMC